MASLEEVSNAAALLFVDDNMCYVICDSSQMKIESIS